VWLVVADLSVPRRRQRLGDDGVDDGCRRVCERETFRRRSGGKWLGREQHGGRRKIVCDLDWWPFCLDCGFVDPERGFGKRLPG
jgi:hypothetical protein